MNPQVTIQKLVHGGQGLGTLSDGRRVFVWNALPGEVVTVRLIKSKKDHAEGIAEQIIKSSPDRREPDEPGSYLATSPWQMMQSAAERGYKKEILAETFAREKVELPSAWEFVSTGAVDHYRNKMEWGFWGDELGVSLAHFVRGSHGKVKVRGSVLAQDAINESADELVRQINALKLRAGDLKSMIVRTSGQPRHQHTVIALFVKKQDFPPLQKPAGLGGLVVYYSNPKSPASVPTKLLQQGGDRTLGDKILGVDLRYDVLSFFQVNLPIFEQAVGRIDYFTGGPGRIDFYSGVGSIGVPIGFTQVLVESDPGNVAMARQNVGRLPIKVVEATAEKALDYITDKQALIVDPPRAGLHASVIDRITEVQPPQVCYLSCNPSTQARDVKLLQQAGYHIRAFEGYNFFPRTPHIESLCVLSRSKNS